MKYRKKPIVVDAFKWTIDKVPQWWIDTKGITVLAPYDEALIPTLEGVMKVSKGDWVIKGINDEIYPCKDDIFRKIYEKV